MIVIRYDTITGQLKNSKPCAHCITAMQQQQSIKYVVYSTGDAATPFSIEQVKNISNKHTSIWSETN